MPKKEWTDDDVQAAINDAVRIVAEDRDKANYLKLHEKYGEQKPTDDGGAPPPKEEDADPAAPKKKGSLWWGELPE